MIFSYRGLFGLRIGAIIWMAVYFPLFEAPPAWAEIEFLSQPGPNDESYSQTTGFGWDAVSGDYDLDGEIDLIVGAPNFGVISGENPTTWGSVFVMYGPFYAGVETSTPMPLSTYIFGMSEWAELGYSVEFVDTYRLDRSPLDELEAVPVIFAGAPNMAQEGLSSGNVYEYYEEAPLLANWINPPTGQLRQMGYVVSSCLFNDDAYPDLVVGGSQAGGAEYGEVLVYLGGEDSDDNPDVRIISPLISISFGSVLCGMGDINNDPDDLGEIVIGDAPNNKVYIVYGRDVSQDSTGSPVVITDLSSGADTAGVTFSFTNVTGIEGGEDLSGDGIPDLILATGATDDVYIYLGPIGPSLPETPFVTLDGWSNFGDRMAMGGDVNGDGVSDLLVGDRGATVDGKQQVGTVSVVLGGASLKQGDIIDCTTDAGSSIKVLQLSKPEIDANSNFGSSVGFLGDLNGDGRDEIFVTAQGMVHEEVPYGKKGHVYGFDVMPPDQIQLAEEGALPIDSGPGGSGIKVLAVEAVHSGGLPIEVFVDASTINGPDSVELYDNGVGADEVANDNIFTGEFVGVVDPGPHDLAVLVRSHWGNAGDGGFCLQEVSFETVPIPFAKFTNVSSLTTLEYGGSPYSGISVDIGVDLDKDLVVTIGDTNSSATSRVFRQYQVDISGAPVFQLNLTIALPSIRGVAAADFDNDGDQDIFVAHSTSPRLYRNNSGTFENIQGALGLSSLADKSTAACWGDFDRDGWIDLYVVRTSGGLGPLVYPNVYPEQHRLFRNTIGEGGGFVDVTGTSGIQASGPVASLSASWADIDQDSDLDLFVGNLQQPPVGSGVYESLLFVNQGDGTFLEESSSRFGGGMIIVTSHQWADVDNDLDLDFVRTTSDSYPRIYLNDGFGVFSTNPNIVLDAPEGHRGVQIFDHDLDGWKDILLLSKDSSHSQRFFSGTNSPSGLIFLENTENVNLGHLGATMGSVVADFTRDGDADLFLGKPTSSPEFFFKTDSQLNDKHLGRDYVKIRLDSSSGYNNRLGIGSIVTITDGVNSQMQFVDGGSGRGGQNDRDLVFGLDGYSGSVTATIHWPGGFIQSTPPLDISDEIGGEELNTITDMSALSVSNLSATNVINPTTGTLNWTISWETNLYGNPALDMLILQEGGHRTSCWPGGRVVTPSTSGVDHFVEPKAGGGFTHKFILYDEDCIRFCSYYYFVKSGIGPNLISSSTQSGTVQFCPSQF